MKEFFKTEIEELTKKIKKYGYPADVKSPSDLIKYFDKVAKDIAISIAYLDYKIKWVERIDAKEAEKVYNDYLFEKEVYACFSDYLEDNNGFNGELFASKEEFVDNEYDCYVPEPEWENYGDVNYEEYGGILLKKSTETAFDFVQVLERDDGEKICLEGSIDVDDLKDNNELKSYSELNENSSDEDYAISALDYYGGENFGATSINNEVPSPHFDNCVVSQKDLKVFLKEIGFE